jgi:hypothetical protein
MTRLFEPDENGRRPCHGGDERYASDPAWRDLILFHEFSTPTPAAAAVPRTRPAGRRWWPA